jgi:hypothetical protein
VTVELSITGQRKAKKRRAQRARARQRSRHDLRSRYRPDDIPVENIAIVSIEDPFTPAAYLADGALSAEARLAPAQHADGSSAPGQMGWTPPRRPMTTVIRSLRDDAIGRMHSRHQLTEAQYGAARAFQQAADQALFVTVRSLDLTKTRVSGGAPPDPLPPHRQRAMKRLRHAEEQVAHRHGNEGLSLTRAVLVERQSVEQAARLRGAQAAREIWFWSRLFRRCLDALALAFGLATSTRPAYKSTFIDGQDPALDSERQARPGELADPALRRGRA